MFFRFSYSLKRFSEAFLGTFLVVSHRFSLDFLTFFSGKNTSPSIVSFSWVLTTMGSLGSKKNYPNTGICLRTLRGNKNTKHSKQNQENLRKPIGSWETFKKGLPAVM